MSRVVGRWRKKTKKKKKKKNPSFKIAMAELLLVLRIAMRVHNRKGKKPKK
jgi:hypothetical protein